MILTKFVFPYVEIGVYIILKMALAKVNAHLQNILTLIIIYVYQFVALLQIMMKKQDIVLINALLHNILMKQLMNVCVSHNLFGVMNKMIV